MGSMFAPSPPPPPPAPEVKPPAPMPDPDSAAVREAARRDRLKALSRGGRASTILTAPSDREPYSATRLGDA